MEKIYSANFDHMHMKLKPKLECWYNSEWVLIVFLALVTVLNFVNPLIRIVKIKMYWLTLVISKYRRPHSGRLFSNISILGHVSSNSCLTKGPTSSSPWQLCKLMFLFVGFWEIMVVSSATSPRCLIVLLSVTSVMVADRHRMTGLTWIE